MIWKHNKYFKSNVIRLGVRTALSAQLETRVSFVKHTRTPHIFCKIILLRVNMNLIDSS